MNIEQLTTHIFQDKQDKATIIQSPQKPHAYICTCNAFFNHLANAVIAYNHTSDDSLHCKHIREVIDWKTELKEPTP